MHPRLLASELGAGQGVAVDRAAAARVGRVVGRDDVVAVFGDHAARAGEDEVGAAVLQPDVEVSGAAVEFVGGAGAGVVGWVGKCSGGDEGRCGEGDCESGGEVEMEAHVELVFADKGRIC